MIHELKTWPEFFIPIRDGRKRFELRKADRAYAVGDVLRLCEWDPDAKSYTGRECSVHVTYLLSGGLFGLDRDTVCMSIELRDDTARDIKPEAPPPICTDCKYCEDVGPSLLTILGCGVEGLTDPVDGKHVYRRCSVMRAKSGKCGPEGKLFEPEKPEAP